MHLLLPPNISSHGSAECHMYKCHQNSMLDGETTPVRVINLSVTPSNYIYSLNLLDALSKLITN